MTCSETGAEDQIRPARLVLVSGIGRSNDVEVFEDNFGWIFKIIDLLLFMISF